MYRYRIHYLGLFTAILLLSGCSTSKNNPTPSPLKADYSADVNTITSNGNSILMNAAEAGDINWMTHLINAGADINYQHKNGTFPLYQFVTQGYSKNSPEASLEMVKWMISKGANYKKAGYNGYTLIHVSEDLALTQYLIELGGDIKSLTSNNATTLIGSLASNLDGKPENTAIQNYLIEHCVDLNQTAQFKPLPLNALDMAYKYHRNQAGNLIKTALKNPPKQCQGVAILPPIVSFYNLPETFDSENVNIALEVQAQGFGIGEVVLIVNGAEIAANDDRALKVKRDGLKVKNFNIKLQNGYNEIRAYAYDETNKIRGDEIVHEVVAEYALNSKPKIYAIVIGIDEFKAKELNLKYAEADASLFGATLYKRTKDIFSKVNIDYMKKMDFTTKTAILAKLDTLKDISANDFFVFYSATHGIVVDDTYYMITSNLDQIDNAKIKEDSISEDDLRQAFKKIPTANKLLLFDTCYSGSINEKVSKQLAKSSTSKLNLTSMTAANSVQTALEGLADGHGIFTYVLSEALEGDADFDHDGLISSMELVNYTNAMVPKEAKKFNHTQTPAHYQSGQVFVVSKLRDFKGTEADLKPQYFKAPEVEKLVVSMNSNDVKSFNSIVVSNKIKTSQTIEKIKVESAQVEARKATQAFKTADKKFKFGKSSFIFNDNSIFLDIKDPIKEHFVFTDSKGRHLIVFDFYSKEQAPRVVTELDTEKVSDIYMADRGDWYRVTLQTKTEQSYEHISNDEGVFIKLKSK
ncbi:MAG: caspase family protein [Sulfurimonas sp.]|jgi:uncharacterized caspase-like protein